MKARTIDRVKLTSEKFGFEMRQKDGSVTRLSECPNCGSQSLRLDGGCMSCLSCGWSACG